jgi:hypothetical protein
VQWTRQLAERLRRPPSAQGPAVRHLPHCEALCQGTIPRQRELRRQRRPCAGHGSRYKAAPPSVWPQAPIQAARQKLTHTCSPSRRTQEQRTRCWHTVLNRIAESGEVAYFLSGGGTTRAYETVAQRHCRPPQHLNFPGEQRGASAAGEAANNSCTPSTGDGKYRERQSLSPP